MCVVCVVTLALGLTRMCYKCMCNQVSGIYMCLQKVCMLWTIPLTRTTLWLDVDYIVSLYLHYKQGWT